MRKIILWLAILLPTFANAQWVNGVIQRDNTSTWIRYLQGANQVRLALYSDLASATDTTVLRTVANSYSLAGMQTKLNGYVTTNTSQNITGPKTFTSLVQGSNGFRTTSGLTYSQLDASGQSLTFATSSASLILGYNTLTTNRAINFPDASGTVALLSSPAFTGTPTAPTATGGTNTTQIATTAFVQNAVSGVTSPWTRTGTNIAPTTANDRVTVSSNQTGVNIIDGTSSGAGATAIAGTYSGTGLGIGVGGYGGSGVAINGVNNSASYPSGWFQNNNASGNIVENRTGSTLVSFIRPNGGFNWDGATATTTAGWDASKNLVSITNTGTGNAVRQTSPTLVTPSISGLVSVSNVTDEQIRWQGNSSKTWSIQAESPGTYFYNNTDAKIAIYMSNSGNIRMPVYTAGSAQFDASGNLSSVSDINAKENIVPYTKGLDALKNWKPQTYLWKEITGLDRAHRYTSLIAQDIEKTVPEAVFEVPEGQYKSVQDRPVIATMVNAINQLREIIEKQDARILYLEKQLNK